MTATTWNPSTVSGGALSDGNLELTYSSGAFAFVLGTTTKTTGKWYFELTFGGGTVFYAVDIGNALIWIKTPGNDWNSEAPGNDPGTGTGGVSISALSPTSGLTIFATVNSGADDFSLGGLANSSVNSSNVPDNADNVACWDWYNNGTLFVNGNAEGGGLGDFTITGGTVILNVGASSFVGSIPSGFSSWDAQGVSGTWASTEAPDTFAAVGYITVSGAWASTEAPDRMSFVGYTPATAVWASTENPDRMAFYGSVNDAPAPSPGSTPGGGGGSGGGRTATGGQIRFIIT